MVGSGILWEGVNNVWFDVSEVIGIQRHSDDDIVRRRLYLLRKTRLRALKVVNLRTVASVVMYDRDLLRCFVVCE